MSNLACITDKAGWIPNSIEGCFSFMKPQSLHITSAKTNFTLLGIIKWHTKYIGYPKISPLNILRHFCATTWRHVATSRPVSSNFPNFPWLFLAAVQVPPHFESLFVYKFIIIHSKQELYNKERTFYKVKIIEIVKNHLQLVDPHRYHEWNCSQRLFLRKKPCCKKLSFSS